ncbi:13688_t:CDS:2, partial [Racocetra persica]
ANKSNRKCICRACMDAVGKEITLQDDSIKLTNTKHYCYNHLKDCSYFVAKYLSEQIKNILSSVVPSTSKNQAIIWHNIVNYELMGIVFITSSGETLIWRADDISIERQQQEEVIAQIRILFKETKELNIRENCIVTDSARSYTAARHFLRREMRDKMFIPCFAHQVNCCIGDIFKESVEFKNASKRTLVTKDDMISDDELKLLADVKAAINRDSFWNSLVTLHDMLHLFCRVLDIMQRDKARLHNVLHIFSYFIQIFKELELSYYYNAWFEDDPKHLLHELELYKQQKYPFIKKTFRYFKGDIHLWWSHNSDAAPELSRIDEKMVAMSQLHAEILQEELLIDEELKEEWNDLDDTKIDIDFLDSEIHTAKNQATK